MCTPFTAIVSRVNKRSEGFVDSGKQVVIMKNSALACIKTLINKEIDFTSHLNRHYGQNIGKITKAWINGDALYISGYFYNDKFKEKMRLFRKLQNSLGFSIVFSYKAIKATKSNIIGYKIKSFYGVSIGFKKNCVFKTTALTYIGE